MGVRCFFCFLNIYKDCDCKKNKHWNIKTISQKPILSQEVIIDHASWNKNKKRTSQIDHKPNHNPELIFVIDK